MRVPALALFTRALRVDVRQKRSHLLRMAFAGLIFLAMAAAEISSRTTGAPGLDFFRSIAYFNVAVLTLAGVGYFATAVTEDKDEGTFDLLKLAGIGPLGLLLGKSTTRLAATLLILAVQFPFTFLAVTLGGVLPQQVFAMYASLAAYAILLANLGLLCSVVSRGSAMATGLMAVLLGLYFVAKEMVEGLWPELVRAGLLSAGGRESVVAGLHDSSIWFRMRDVLQARFTGGIWDFQVQSNLAAAGVLFGLSWWGLRIVSRADRSRRPLSGWLAKLVRGRPSRRSRRAWRHALFWKELYGTAGGPRILAIKSLVLVGMPAVLRWIAWTDPVRPSGWRDISENLMSLMLVLLAAESSIYASLVFRSDVRQQTLPLLAMLPVSIARLAWAKAAAIVLALAPAAACFLIAAGLHPDGFASAVGRWLSAPADWLFLLQFLVFLHATAFLSLVVKWGALPLALVMV
ncbi:MAG TPA: hypothetical protein VML55_09970, partial [Planctomycetaceae bacterium]|nr:hypothetical protein [Planctomycetaceae bacterium]